MHLANGEQTLRYGGVAQEKTEVKVNSNGTMDINANGAYTNGHAQTNGESSEFNEVDITALEGQSLDAALDAILTAWTILIQRYQRDVFHQFSWGIKGAGSDGRQCIQTAELNLLNHSNATSLASKIRDVRLKNVSLDGATIFLNDGTKEEVGKLSRTLCSALTQISGHLRFPLNSERARCEQLHGGNLQACLDTRLCRSCVFSLLLLIPFQAHLIP
jgi:hypothetical protein